MEMKSNLPQDRYFSDESNKGKYSDLKNRLIPRNVGHEKVRVGAQRDGGYVYLKDFFNEADTVYSCGIGSDPEGISFDQHCAELGKKVYMYDGTISKVPAENSNFFFEKTNIEGKVFAQLLERNQHSNKKNMVLKLDIDGYEYDLINRSLDSFYQNFSLISMEAHGLIEEIPQSWRIDEPIKSIKMDKKVKIDFFEKLNQYYYLYHIHPNVHAPFYGDFCDSLELSYIRKDLIENPGIEYNSYPVMGLDYCNFPPYEDPVIKWW